MRYVASIEPVHPDGSVCTHTPRTRRETGCAGRTGYVASCDGGGCTWSKADRRRKSLVAERTSHLTSHLTAPATSH
ncbi:hypothetical protein [Streptomyces mirabilis]|uniref:hypothetical protein n=1 Tax=Streptomyces mirabilis TaxID=68239 RepID=UPI0036A4BC82